MATTALHSAATGLSALATQIDVVANNLANVNTTAFKSSRVNFEDIFYLEKAQPGVENANGDQRPAGVYVGLGVRVSNTDYSFEQGSAIETGRPLDVMVEGQGFFPVDIVQESGSGIGFTRAGNFFRNSEGDLVLGSADGPKLDPPVTIPDDAVSIEITANGEVFITTPGSATSQNVGQIELANFINPNGLKPIGGNIFIETDASGPPAQGNPGEDAFGVLRQGFLESSNVNPVRELIDLIKTQRAFELNSQAIQTADEALQVVANLRRG